MVGHAVSRTHRLHVAAIAAVEADDLLAVPIGELDQIQHSDRPEHGKVPLPDRVAQRMDAAAERRAGDVGLGACAALALVVGCALVPAHIDIIALAFAVSTVGVGGADAEARHLAVCDLELELAAFLRPLIPVFRNLDQHTGRAGLLDHAAPRQAVVEGAVSAFTAQCRGGVCKERCIIRAGQSRFAGLVPDNAINADVGKLKGIVLVLRGADGLSRGLLALGGGDLPAAKRGRVQGDSAGLAGAGDGRGQGSVATHGDDSAAGRRGQDDAAKMHRRGVLASVLGDAYIGGVAGCAVLGSTQGVTAGALDLDLRHAVVPSRGRVGPAIRQGSRDDSPGRSSGADGCDKVRQAQSVRAADCPRVDGVVRGQARQLGCHRPQANAGQSYGVASVAARSTGDGALAVGQGQSAASHCGNGQLRQGGAQHVVERRLQVCYAGAKCISKGDVLRREVALHFVQLAKRLADCGLDVVSFQPGSRAVKRDIFGGDRVKDCLVGIRVYVVFCQQLFDPLLRGDGRQVALEVNVGCAGNCDDGRKLHDEIRVFRSGRDFKSAFILKDRNQGVGLLSLQGAVDADLVHDVALRQSGVGDLDSNLPGRVVAFTSFLDVGNGKRLALVCDRRCLRKLRRGYRPRTAHSPGKVHAFPGHRLCKHGRA